MQILRTQHRLELLTYPLPFRQALLCLSRYTKNFAIQVQSHLLSPRDLRGVFDMPLQCPKEAFLVQKIPLNRLF